ncbi:MAG: hypothetical protein JWO22_229 [Frankiales bacterium]|nr:hypothetical protein [Frankiales bacterium]
MILRRPAVALALAAALLGGFGLMQQQSEASSGPRALFFGDSLFAGTGTSPKRPVLATDTSRLLHWRPTVDAVGGTGYTTRGHNPKGRTYLYRLQHDGFLTRHRYQVILLEGGTNDALFGDLPALSTRMTEVVGYVREKQPQARLVVVGGFTPAGHDNARFREMERTLAATAHELSLQYVSQYRYHVLSKGFLFKDHFHPNRSGYRRMANDLATQLRGAKI